VDQTTIYDQRPAWPVTPQRTYTPGTTQVFGHFSGQQPTVNPFLQANGETKPAIDVANFNSTRVASHAVVKKVASMFGNEMTVMDLDAIYGLTQPKKGTSALDKISVQFHQTLDGQTIAVPSSTVATKTITTFNQLDLAMMVLADALGGFCPDAELEFRKSFCTSIKMLQQAHPHDVRLVVDVVQKHINLQQAVLTGSTSRPKFLYDPLITLEVVSFRQPIPQPPATPPTRPTPQTKAGPAKAKQGGPRVQRAFNGDRAEAIKSQCINAKSKQKCAFLNCPFNHIAFPAVP
jgi:hypothetical protein